MRSKPKLVRVLTPPPVAPTNVLQGTSPAAIAAKAMGVHLTKTVATSAARTSAFRLHLTTVHPSKPLVAFLVVPDPNDKKKFSTSVVVQHAKTRAVVWSMSLGDLAMTMYQYVAVEKATELIIAKQAKALKDWGKVQKLDFFDPSTLYWSGHGCIGKPQDLESRWNYLLIHFQTRILVVNLRRQSVAVARAPPIETGLASPDRTFSPILASITQDALGASITSNAEPVSPEYMVIGTNNGTIHLYDWKANVVVQSVKVVSNKSDSVVRILSTNRYGTPDQYAESRRRVVCLTKKGSALLLELAVAEGIVHNIGPPLAKFEGGFVPNYISKFEDDSSGMEHIVVRYCGFRDLLLWAIPSKGTKGKLLAWDLGKLPEPEKKTKKKAEPVKPDPLLVMQFPYESMHTVYPGWFHEGMPMESMACAVITKEGDFQIVVAPLYSSGSSIKNPYSAFTILRFNLNQLVQRDLVLQEDQETGMRMQSIYCPPLRDASIFYLATNLGVLLVKMLDGNLVQVPGTRHAHLNANFGGMGKAVLSAKGPEITYSILEPAGGTLAVDPIGPMECKNTISVYESPPPFHLPPEIHKRPVRLPPLFLLSPSRTFLCCFWKEEMRYEVLHMQVMLEKVTSRTQTGKSPVVASGNGIASFAWIGDEDVFSLLYNPEQDLALKVGIDLSAPSALSSATNMITDIAKLSDLKKLRDIASAKTIANKVVDTASKLQSLKGLQDLGKGTVKLGKGVGKGAVGTLKKTGKVTLATGRLTMKTTQGAVKGGTKAASKTLAFATFGLYKGKKNKDQDDENTVATNHSMGDRAIGQSSATDKLERKFPWVELRCLVTSDTNSTTTTAIGELSLRSGNKNPPTVLFGGPVLCVASKVDDDDEGLAYFYTKKDASSEESAEEYVSSGPAFPCPDLVVWDDDGRLCAVVIRSMVSIYLSDEPEFIMLGTQRLGTPEDVDAQVTSARFIHGALYCSTRSSVQVIFLGDLTGGVCHLDLYTLASSEVSMLPSSSIVSDYKSLTPATLPMPLSYPTILGYQHGALVISTVSGVQSIPLGAPLLRIGALLGAGQAQKAAKWFDAVPANDHETLANFLERRGVPDLALELGGISLETRLDVSMRYGYADRLEEMLDIFGLDGLRAIDRSRGFSSSIFGPSQEGTSIVVCVGAYLLSYGKVELVRRMASECIVSGEAGKREAFMLAGLLSCIDPNDAKRVMSRAVAGNQDDDWVVGKFVRDNIFSN